MYHVPAAQVLSSQATDLVLMLAVAATMVPFDFQLSVSAFILFETGYS
jgi:hypothetical protein